MADDINKPSLWQRTKAAVKGFFSHLAGYIPRGIVFTGMIFAASALAETFIPGFDSMMKEIGLNVLGRSGRQLLAKFAGHMALGALFSGVIGGAVDCYRCGSEGSQGFGLPSLPSGGTPQQAHSVGHKLARSVSEGMAETADYVMPGSGLPLHIMHKTTEPGKGR